MCTCCVYATKHHYFGRNLDLDFSYGEQVAVTPRNMVLPFRLAGELTSHPAVIGMAFVLDGYPLYYDAANEYGLAMAGLNFPGNGFYEAPDASSDQDQISPFEFIPWILGKCRNLQEARALLGRIRLVSVPYSKDLPITPLHWMISDREGSLVVEATKKGLHVYDNPIGVMTNNPEFDYQLLHLAQFRNVTPVERESSFADGVSLPGYCAGMGGFGIPGDLSSPSRFVRAAFTKCNSISDDSEEQSVSQFFHILSSVEMQRGCCRLPGGNCDITVYSSCINVDTGVYYYRTYDNSQISAVDLHREDLSLDHVISYPLVTKQQFHWVN